MTTLLSRFPTLSLLSYLPSLYLPSSTAQKMKVSLFSLSLSLSLSLLLAFIAQIDQSDPLPESAVASQLLDAIRSKEPVEKLGEVLDSLASLEPASECERDLVPHIHDYCGDVIFVEFFW